jgi:N-6 DNA Methylase
MARQSAEFQTIRSEGGLLPPDLRRRLLDPKEKLDGKRPEDYGLPQSERLNEAITQSWNRLRKHWLEFRGAAANLPASEAGTGITNDKWSLPLMRELGFGLLPTSAGPVISGRTYAINRFFGPVPIHLVGCGLSLDHRAAGVRGAAAGNPHGLVQEFLNRSGSACLWGIVSNGLQLRVLRDNQALSRQSFLEFDLEAMFSGEVYSDFVVLWLIAHATRFASREENRADSCWLEQWTKIANEQGARALGDLRGGVERALQNLGEGLTSHQKNTALRDALRSGEVTLADFHGQLLRVVYRLIFLFVAEDRTIDGCSLLHPRNGSDAAQLARERYASHYGTARMRDMAARIKGSRHGDLWQQFKLLVGALSGQANFAAAREQLALPTLGSFLWDPVSTAALNDAELTNHDFLEALRDLAFTRQDKMLRPVDYKNLGAEELGGVYESLLALTPQISADGARFTFAEFAGNERKTSGSYYTPDSLVQCLLDSALDPVVEEAIKGKAGVEAEKAILALEVCDPAVGSGHFLVGAAHRLARHLARVRALAQGESEPSPLLYQHALRDIIGRCLYGVDVNPMAVELCKVSLWMEALEPGKPLSFLDHRIKVGNSLMGATPALIEKGIPDEAFKALGGDDRKFVAALKRANKTARQQSTMLLFSGEIVWQALGKVKDGLIRLEAIADDTLGDIHAKQAEFDSLMTGGDYRDQKLVADAWCAAFTVVKTKETAFRLTEEEFSVILANPRACPEATRTRIRAEAEAHSFFHWHLEFPDVFEVVQMPENAASGWSGGFDVVLGNPPWERVKLQEREWFAQRDTTISKARNASARKQLIQELQSRDPGIYQEFLSSIRKAEGESHIFRNSGKYPLCGTGDVNLFSLFTELSLSLINSGGRVGLIVPPGIATDDTYKDFIRSVTDQRQLVSFYNFTNRGYLFVSTESTFSFALLTLSKKPQECSKVAAQLWSVSDLADIDRVFSLSPETISRMNPNTHNLPTIRSVRDFHLMEKIYSSFPILLRENPVISNPWNCSFASPFHMSNDSALFETEHVLTPGGYELNGNIFERDDTRYLPLYESKLAYQFNHRHSSFVLGDKNPKKYGARAKTEILHEAALSSPSKLPIPRYWVIESDVRSHLPEYWGYEWVLGYRRTINAVADSRSVVAFILPRYGVGDSIFLLLPKDGPLHACALLALLNCFVFDYVARQKASGGNLNFYVMKQLPVVLPEELTTSPHWDSSERSILRWIQARVVELCYTAHDLCPFARDCGYDCLPFQWDDERRFLMRCELDAAFCHLYGISRDEAYFILETFDVAKRKDEAAYSHIYRTKDTVLEIYDEMAGAAGTGMPYQTRLNPPPADPSVAHSAKNLPVIGVS